MWAVPVTALQINEHLTGLAEPAGESHGKADAEDW